MDKRFVKWREKPRHKGEVFNCDGIIDLDEWEKQDIRILFILKEAYHKEAVDSNIYDLAADLRENGPWKGIWNRIAEWARAILLTEPGEIPAYRKLSKTEANSFLRRIAVINIKKSGGVSRSDSNDIMSYAKEDADELYEQILTIDPNVIICGYTFEFLNEILKIKGEEIPKKESPSDNYHYSWKNKIIIDYYHPANQYPALLSFFGICGCYLDALRRQ